MGLLDRAAALEEPDEMGKLLVERILRLPKGLSGVSAALNLLKTYSSFSSCLCLHRENDVYTSYAVTGMANNCVNIPVSSLPLASGGFSKLNAVPPQLGSAGPAWFFPLDEKAKSVLLISESRSVLFNSSSLCQILKRIRPILINEAAIKGIGKTGAAANKAAQNESARIETYQNEILSSSELEDAGSDTADSIENKLAHYTRGMGPFQGIVIEPQKTNAGTGEFLSALKNCVSTFGIAFELKPARYIVLFPKPLNRNLIAHRLTKNFNSRLLLAFESSAVQDAVQKIRPCLEP